MIARRRAAARDRRRRQIDALVAGIAQQEIPGYDDRLMGNRLAAMAHGAPPGARRVLRLCRQTSPALTCTLLAAQFAGGVLMTLSLLQISDVLTTVLAAGPTAARVMEAVPALVAVGLLVLARAGSEVASGAVQARLAPRVGRHVEVAIHRAALDADLAAFDDPDWYEMLARVRDRGVMHASMAVGQLVQVLSALVGVVAVAAALTALHPLLLVLLAVSVLPDAWAARRSAELGYAGMLTYAMLRRRQALIGTLATERRDAAEVRAYGLQRFLGDHYEQLADAAGHENERVELAQVRIEATGRAVSGLAAALTFAGLAFLLATSAMPLAGAGAAVVALTMTRSLLARLFLNLNRLYELGLSVADTETFLERSAARAVRRTGATAPERFSRLDVEGVTFTYPGAEQAVLHDVSITVRPGEVVALVGENGSGKTTLARVLSGLYEPERGAVRWDGTDLRTWDAASVHRRMALIGQDTARWPFTAGQAIALGDTETDTDTDTDTDTEPNTGTGAAPPARLDEAARVAGADAVIATLPHGYDTLLSRLFHGGHELSGGQWQTLSIARGVYRDAPLLICDEPTAALDPRAEDRVYQAIRRLAGRTDTGPHGTGRAVVLITHRLASVRLADRIYVLRHGRVVETGDHGSLMAAGGLYRELYTLQAAGYQHDGHQHDRRLPRRPAATVPIERAAHR